MKSTLSFFGIFFFFLSFTISAQVTCLEFESPVQTGRTALPEEIQSLIGQSIELSAQGIYFKDSLFSTRSVRNQPFTGREYLLYKYSDLYNFSNFSDRLYGDITYYRYYGSFSVLNTKEIEVIKITDQGIPKYFIHLHEYLFKMTECKNYEPCYGEGLKIKNYDSDSLRFILKQPRYKSEVIPAQFKTHVEQMMGPQVTKLEITPAKLEKRILKLSGDQVNTCSEITAIYDTIYRDFIVAESYQKLELVPKVEETVSEMVLAKEGYHKVIDFIPHEYIFSDSCLVSSATKEIWNNLSVSNNCSNQIFLPCINYESNDLNLDKGIFRIEKTRACPTGYETRLSGCYKIDFIGPEYSSRSYQKLVQLATTKATIFPAEYIKRPVQVIKNIDEIPEDCIKTEIIDWSYLKKIEEASSKHVGIRNYDYGQDIISIIKNEAPFSIIEEIEVEGESIHLDATNKIYCGSNDLVTVELVCEKFINDTLIEKIIAKLRLSGYDIPLEKNKQEYLEALTAFQKKNNLVIGVLSIETLEFMDISY